LEIAHNHEWVPARMDGPAYALIASSEGEYLITHEHAKRKQSLESPGTNQVQGVRDRRSRHSRVV